MNDNKLVDNYAKTIWDYMLMNQSLEKVDAILVLGSHDPSVADRGIDLFFEGWASWLIFSGGVVHGKGILKNTTPKTEGEAFYDMAIARNVPKENIILENHSTNTGENFRFTETLLQKLGHSFQKFIVVQKPYMERRTYATGMAQMRDKLLIISSPKYSYEEYLASEIPKEKFINTMVGDLQRIKIYPKIGFQIEQHIPEKVWQAFENLVALGFDKRLAKDI